MAKHRKRVDPVKQREKRAKIAAAVGGVVFLIVCAVEVPSLISMLNQQAPAPVAAATTPAATSSPPPLANVAAPAGVTPAASGTPGLVNSDVPPAPSGGSQLVSFSVFPTKNPFTPQVPAGSSAAGAAATTTATTTTPASTTPAKTTATTTTSTTTTAATTTTPAPTSTTPPVVSAVPSAPGTTTTTAAPQPTAAISVNGVVERVAQDGTFPSSGPVFRLVSWSKATAQIGIVGGSYASGDSTLPLQLGVAVTLQNQTDGKRYKLLLLSLPTP